MSLAITSRISSNVVIVDINGRLSVLDVALREHMNELLEEGHRAFVLNLANVPYIDSFGLGQLITIWTSVRNRGGQLILLRPTDHVQTLFRITKLNTIFQISGEETQAVRSARTNIFETVVHTIPINPVLS
jgi:anti-sigma B factor antagonist